MSSITSILDVSGAGLVPIKNTVAPPEGPGCVPLVIDFSAGGTQLVQVDLTLVQQRAKLSGIQTMFIDNSANGAEVTFAFENTQEEIMVNPNGQGFWPVLLNTMRFTVACTGGTGILRFNAINVPIQYVVWGSASGTFPPFNFDGAGDLLVDDPTVRTNTSALAALISGGRFAVATNVAHGSVTDRSIASASGASQTLMAANAARQYILIQAPLTADAWFNPTGGAAVIGGAGCYQITAGGKYESGPYAFTGQINIITTIALVVSAAEG